MVELLHMGHFLLSFCVCVCSAVIPCVTLHPEQTPLSGMFRCITAVLLQVIIKSLKETKAQEPPNFCLLSHAMNIL